MVNGCSNGNQLRGSLNEEGSSRHSRDRNRGSRLGSRSWSAADYEGTSDSDIDIHAIRVGLTYRFGGPMFARY
jgi:hypothetical protein